MKRTDQSNTRSAAEGFFGFPTVAQIYIGATIAAGLSCIALAVPRVDVGAPWPLAAVLLISLATATVHLPLPLLHGRSSMSLSHTVVVFAMLTMGTGEAVLVAVATTLVQSTVRKRSRKQLHQALFNVASLAITVTLAGGTFFGLRVDQGHWLEAYAGPLASAELVYFAANTMFVATAVALTSRQSVAKIWVTDFLWMGPGYFVGALAAGVGVALSGRSLYWWVTIAIPLYITYRSYRTYMNRVEAGQILAQQALEIQDAIVQALTAAIESKDRTSQFEMRRLSACTEALGQAVGLDTPDLHALRTAALLHDIGNLGVPEHILGKPGPLTFEEYDRIKIHPRVGAEILKDVPFTVPVSPLILGHHEHWDGSGYPSGLKGPAIPLGARILAVADCFTALMSDRPHRPAFSYWESLATLKRCSGTWFDPALVERFVEILPDIEARVMEESSEQDRMAPAPGSELKTERAFEDIAEARHEARALFEIAQALTSTQGVAEAVDTIVEKLAGLIPIESGALFLWNEDLACFSCRYSSGLARAVLMEVEADTLDNLRSAVEHGLASTSGPQARPVVFLSQLQNGDRRLGALAIVIRSRHASHGDHQRLLDHVAPQAGIVIHNALAFEETRQLSLTDPLTNLPNRRYLLQHLGFELSRADRHNRPVALLLMDVNRFKEINDTHGHATGDLVLCEIARVVRFLLRPYDVCARLGGDEFVLVLWDCDTEMADHRRQQLQETIASTAAPSEVVGSNLPSVSIGIAVYPIDGHSVDQLLGVADQRMYDIKTKNRAATDPRRAVEIA